MAGKSQYTRDAEATRASSGGTSSVGADESETEHQGKLGAERKTFTASAIGGEKKTPKGPMPKQSDYPSMGAWQAALRDWRATDADDSARAGRASAVKGKLGASQ